MQTWERRVEFTASKSNSTQAEIYLESNSTITTTSPILPFRLHNPIIIPQLRAFRILGEVKENIQ